MCVGGGKECWIYILYIYINNIGYISNNKTLLLLLFIYIGYIYNDNNSVFCNYYLKEGSNASNHAFVGVCMQILKRFKVSLLDCIKSLRMHDVQSVNIIKINMCLLCNIVRCSFWVGSLFLHPLLNALLLSIHHPWAKRARETSRFPMFGHEHLIKDGDWMISSIST